MFLHFLSLLSVGLVDCGHDIGGLTTNRFWKWDFPYCSVGWWAGGEPQAIARSREEEVATNGESADNSSRLGIKGRWEFESWRTFRLQNPSHQKTEACRLSLKIWADHRRGRRLVHPSAVQ